MGKKIRGAVKSERGAKVLSAVLSLLLPALLVAWLCACVVDWASVAGTFSATLKAMAADSVDTVARVGGSVGVIALMLVCARIVAESWYSYAKLPLDKSDAAVTGVFCAVALALMDFALFLVVLPEVAVHPLQALVAVCVAILLMWALTPAIDFWSLSVDLIETGRVPRSPLVGKSDNRARILGIVPPYRRYRRVCRDVQTFGMRDGELLVLQSRPEANRVREAVGTCPLSDFISRRGPNALDDDLEFPVAVGRRVDVPRNQFATIPSSQVARHEGKLFYDEFIGMYRTAVALVSMNDVLTDENGNAGGFGATVPAQSDDADGERDRKPARRPKHAKRGGKSKRDRDLDHDRDVVSRVIGKGGDASTQAGGQAVAASSPLPSDTGSIFDNTADNMPIVDEAGVPSIPFGQRTDEVDSEEINRRLDEMMGDDEATDDLAKKAASMGIADFDAAAPTQTKTGDTDAKMVGIKAPDGTVAPAIALKDGTGVLQVNPDTVVPVIPSDRLDDSLTNAGLAGVLDVKPETATEDAKPKRHRTRKAPAKGVSKAAAVPADGTKPEAKATRRRGAHAKPADDGKSDENPQK